MWAMSDLNEAALSSSLKELESYCILDWIGPDDLIKKEARSELQRWSLTDRGESKNVQEQDCVRLF